MLALSVREAIRDAVAAFAPEGQKPKQVVLPSPATHEAIYASIQAVKQGQAAEVHV
jgi:xanthine dehydrogenase large subunit